MSRNRQRPSCRGAELFERAMKETAAKKEAEEKAREEKQKRIEDGLEFDLDYLEAELQNQLAIEKEKLTKKINEKAFQARTRAILHEDMIKCQREISDKQKELTRLTTAYNQANNRISHLNLSIQNSRREVERFKNALDLGPPLASSGAQIDMELPDPSMSTSLDDEFERILEEADNEKVEFFLLTKRSGVDAKRKRVADSIVEEILSPSPKNSKKDE